MFQYLNKRISNSIAITIILLLALLVGGITLWQYLDIQKEKFEIVEIKIPKKVETQTIKTKSGDKFSVVLEANLTTGYLWEVNFDSIYIQLINRKYTPYFPEKIGAGGEETFNFLALKSGETKITFSYLRPWEKEKPPLKKKIYKIIIE